MKLAVRKDPLSPCSTLDWFFEQFVRERTYLHNVTPKTRDWYQTAWKAFKRFQADAPPRPPGAPLISRARPAAVRRASSRAWCQTHLVQLLAPRMNAFCGWLMSKASSVNPCALRPQKLEKRILRLARRGGITQAVSFRPKTYVEWRVHAVVCTILDTGCRINELLTVRVADFDMDNLLLTVNGRAAKNGRCHFQSSCGKCCFASIR